MDIKNIKTETYTDREYTDVEKTLEIGEWTCEFCERTFKARKINGDWDIYYPYISGHYSVDWMPIVVHMVSCEKTQKRESLDIKPMNSCRNCKHGL